MPALLRSDLKPLLVTPNFFLALSFHFLTCLLAEVFADITYLNGNVMRNTNLTQHYFSSDAGHHQSHVQRHR